MRTFYWIILLIVTVRINGQPARRFIVTADAHHYSPSAAFTGSILYEIALAAIDEQVDFIFFAGDMIIRGFGSPPEEDSVLKDWRFVLDTLFHHNIRVFACRGNNDLSSREAWDSLFSGRYLLPQNGPEAEKNITYAIEYDNLLFIALDEYIIYHQVNQEWLDEILAGTDREHIFAAGHEPAFKLFNTNCLGAYPIERNLFWESLTKAGAKAYFCGHDHFYDHTTIDDGDDNMHNDVHQVIAGTAGGSFATPLDYNGDNGRWTPVRLYHEENHGYVLVEIAGSEVQMTWKHRLEPHVYEYGGDAFTFSPAETRLLENASQHVFIRNTPNPFHNATLIRYRLPLNGNADMRIFDLTGRYIMTLVNEELPAGMYEIEWTAAGIRPGIYFCRLTASGIERTCKLFVY